MRIRFADIIAGKMFKGSFAPRPSAVLQQAPDVPPVEVPASPPARGPSGVVSKDFGSGKSPMSNAFGGKKAYSVIT